MTKKINTGAKLLQTSDTTFKHDGCKLEWWCKLKLQIGDNVSLEKTPIYCQSSFLRSREVVFQEFPSPTVLALPPVFLPNLPLQDRKRNGLRWEEEARFTLHNITQWEGTGFQYRKYCLIFVQICHGKQANDPLPCSLQGMLGLFEWIISVKRVVGYKC